MVLREEILGRVFDHLEVDEITSSAAVCKQFDAALPRVTCLATINERFQKGPGLVVWQRLSNVKHVEFDVHDVDLKCFFANVAPRGNQLLSAKLHIYHTSFLVEDEDGSNLKEFGRDLSGFARALKRGYLPNLDHFTISESYCESISDDYPALVPAVDALYLALPPRAAVAAVISDVGKVELLRRILDENDLDINAVDSLGHTPLSLWCWNAVASPQDGDSMASIFNELVSRGANVNQLSALDGWSPCAMAAASGHETGLKLRLLLEAGASVTVGRRQPLPLLCRFGSHAPRNGVALELLLSYGADVMATSPKGQTAMQLLTTHLEKAQDFVKRHPNDVFQSNIPLFQSMLNALGRAAQKMLESALLENNSLKKAAKRAAAAEPKTATRAKKKSRK
jgi:ankyrin repeat protein